MMENLPLHRPDPVLAFNDPLHDSSFCMYGEDSVIHIESERYTRRKYEFINPILTFCELFPNKVDEFFHIVFEESDYAVAPFIRKLLDLKSRSGPRAADAAELDPPYAVDYLLEHLKFPPATNSTAAVARFVKHLLCDDVQIFFCGHHAAHAANAFFSSPFPRALTITLDGGGFDYELDGAGRKIEALNTMEQAGIDGVFFAISASSRRSELAKTAPW